MSNQPLLQIYQLTKDYVSSKGLFQRSQQRTRVLDSLDLTIYEGETLGIVGESGCGKSTLANTLLRLIPATSGEVHYNGQDILVSDTNQLRMLRREMQIVFQNPFSSLNPRMAVQALVGEPIITHTKLRGDSLRQRVAELLQEVGLSSEHLDRHPHELSGGQAQRVVLARALALNPKFLILDEPTSALDVSVQAQIINLLVRLQKENELTYLFISHDLGVVQHISDRIGVMYLGEIVELGSSEAIFQAPQHPYTQALLSATPIPDPESKRQRIILEGNVPSPSDPPSGCRFHTRCPIAIDQCRNEVPTIHHISSQQWARCHLLD
ncbi:MAG: oligopeptide/dipeptide ABC transporter ATP-binding protein [Chloroflexota bacterium]